MVAGPGSPTNSGIPTFNAAYGITAHAGGGNAQATPLNAWLNTITNVVTANDSVMLPVGYAGEIVYVLNHGANAAQVFGYMSTAPGDVVTDTIAPSASATPVNTGVSVPAQGIGVFACIIGQGGPTNGITPAVWKFKLLA